MNAIDSVCVIFFSVKSVKVNIANQNFLWEFGEAVGFRFATEHIYIFAPNIAINYERVTFRGDSFYWPTSLSLLCSI